MTIRRDRLIAWATEQADTITAILEPEYDGIAEELFDESDAGALRAIAAMLKGDTDDWRPIATAPLDGTPVLLYASEHGDDYLAYGRYERYNDGSEGWLAPSFASRSGTSWTTGLNPTLWRPLCWPKGKRRNQLSRAEAAALVRGLEDVKDRRVKAFNQIIAELGQPKGTPRKGKGKR